MKPWKVEDVMTTDVVSVREETPYREVVDKLARNQISAVPVVDDFQRVVGIVSEADLLHKVEFAGDDTERRVFEWGTRKAARGKAHAGTAADLMTAPAITILPDASLVNAAKRMDHEHVKRLPVINDLGRLVGIVSRADLLKMYLRPDTEIRNDIVEWALRRVLFIDPIALEVDVTDGVAVLTGEVDRKSTAEIAVHITKTIPGVVQVVDKLGWSYDDTVVHATTGL